MKIILISPPSPFLSNTPVFPPLGLLTLSAVMKNAGYNNIEFYDFLGDIKLKPIYADIFFIYINTPQLTYINALIDYLRIINPDAKFVAGGPHVTLLPDEIQKFDSLVIGEGEVIVLEILKDYPDLKNKYVGIALKNLDDIPFPDRDIIDITKYANNLLFNNIPSTTYLSSRGCAYNKCAFCSRVWKGVRYRSAQNLVDEIVQVQKKYNINGAVFFDDEFLNNKKRLEKFCDLIKPYNIKWRCLARVTSINDKTLSIISNSGCTGISVGIESGDQRILDTISKGITVEKAVLACKMIKDYGLNLKEFIIIGLPGETHKSIENTDKFIFDTKPNDIDVSILSVLPGSDIWKNPDKYDIKFKKNCHKFWKSLKNEYPNICPISTSQLSFEEILKARDDIENKYKSKEKMMLK